MKITEKVKHVKHGWMNGKPGELDPAMPAPLRAPLETREPMLLCACICKAEHFFWTTLDAELMSSRRREGEREMQLGAALCIFLFLHSPEVV